MVLVKNFQRYAQAGVCNAICSQNSNIASIDANVCAVGACENAILWDFRRQQRVTLIQGTDAFVTHVQFSRDKNLLAIGYSNGDIKIFDRKDISTAGPKISFKGHKSGVNSLSFSPDSLLLASGGKDSSIIVWDLVNETGLFKLRGHKNSVTQVHFTENSKYLISCSKDSFVKFWDISSQHCFFTLVDQKSEIFCFSLLNNDTRLVIGSKDLEIRIYDIYWLQPEEALQSDIDEGQKSLKRLRIDNLEENKDLETTQANNILRCNYFGSLLRSSKGRAVQLGLNSRHSLLVCIGTNVVLDIFRVFNEEERQKMIRKKLKKVTKNLSDENSKSDNRMVKNMENELKNDVSFAFKRLGEYRASTKIKSFCFADQSLDGRLNLIHLLLDNNTVQSLSIELNDAKDAQICTIVSSIESFGHRTDIRSAVFSHDDYIFVTGSQDSIKVWNSGSLGCISTIECQEGEKCLSLLFIPGDKHIVVGTRSGHLLLYELATGELLQKFEDAHSEEVWSLAEMPNMTGFASASGDKTLKYWYYDILNETEENTTLSRKIKREHAVPTLKQHKILESSEGILCAKFTPNSKYIAFGLLDNTARVHFADTFKHFLTLYGHSLPVYCLDISWDSRIIVTGSADKNIKIWGLDFGDCHKSIFAHDDNITNVKFVHSSRLFFSTSKDGSIKQWDSEKFQKIQSLEGHRGEIWGCAISSNGNALLTASYDKSVRIWEKTDELLALDEEQEMEREKLYEKSLTEKADVIPGEIDDDESLEATLAAKKSVDSVKSAENIIEALDIIEKERLGEAEDDKEFTRHPLITAFGCDRDIDLFIIEILRRVKHSDMDRCILMLPFNYCLRLLQELVVPVDRGYHLELASKVIFFIIRIHQNQLINSSEALPLIDKFRLKLSEKISQARDRIGINLAGLELLQLELEAREDVQIFSEFIESRKKRKKKQNQQ